MENRSEKTPLWSMGNTFSHFGGRLSQVTVLCYRFFRSWLRIRNKIYVLINFLVFTLVVMHKQLSECSVVTEQLGRHLILL